MKNFMSLVMEEVVALGTNVLHQGHNASVLLLETFRECWGAYQSIHRT